jgi:hypothetical protein
MSSVVFSFWAMSWLPIGTTMRKAASIRRSRFSEFLEYFIVSCYGVDFQALRLPFATARLLKFLKRMPCVS